MDRHITGRVPVASSKNVHRVPFARAIYKATESSEMKAPKIKHVRRVVLETHNVRGGVSFYIELKKRPLMTNDVICWKGLCVIHRVLMEGHHKVLQDSSYEINALDGIRKCWARDGTSHPKHEVNYAVLNTAFCDFLISKIRFHENNPLFDGNISLEYFQTKTNNQLPDDNTCFKIVQQLLDHQTKLIKLEKTVFNHTENLNETQIFALIPLVLESYAVYTAITYFLRQLINNLQNAELFDCLVDMYYSQYNELRDFYFKASNILQITKVIPVPLLPADPPRFKSMKRKKRKKPQKPAPKPKPQSSFSLLDGPELFPATTQPLVPFDPFAPVEPQASSTPPGWVSFGSTTSFQTPVPQEPALFNPFEVDETVNVDQSSNAFLDDLWQNVLTEPPSKEEQELRRMQEEKEQRERELEETKREMERMREATQMKIKQLEAESASLESNLAKQSEDKDDKLRQALRKIATLEQLVQQLRSRIDQLEEQNAMLVKENQLLKKEKEEVTKKTVVLTAENATIKQRVENLEEQIVEERRQRILNEIEKATRLCENMMFELDSPTFSGNPDATGPGLLESAKNLAKAIENLFVAVASGDEEQIKKAIEDVINANNKLMGDTKGCTNLTDSPQIQQRLLEAGRGAGVIVNDLLSKLFNEVDEEDDFNTIARKFAPYQNRANKQIDEFAKAVDALEDEHAVDDGIDIEALAVEELLKVVKLIEEATNKLMLCKNQPAPADKTEEELEVTSSILEAATAIAQAAKLLVSAGVDAQKERIEQGKLPKGQSSYKRDPVWSEGLISAAKYVAAATQQLVQAANDVAEGKKVDDAALIAASLAVASATAQLVSASKAKADNLNSPTQLALIAASKAIKKATANLVAAAREAALQQEAAEAKKNISAPQNMSSTAFKIEQMKQVEKIIKLEQQLSRERNSLARMRSEEYTGQVQSSSAADPNFEKNLRKLY